jgi:hypothetical protein
MNNRRTRSIIFQPVWHRLPACVRAIASQPLRTQSQARCLCHNLVAAILTCICLASSMACAQDFLGQARLDSVLPESTQLVVASKNVQASYQALESSDMCKHLAGPVWQNVIAKQRAANIGSLVNPRLWLSLDWQDIGSIDQPGAVAAFLDENGETAIVFLAQLGKEAESHPFVQRWLARQGGVQRRKADTINATTKLYSAPSSSKAASNECMAIGSQWICISSSTKAVQTWLGSTKLKPIQAAIPKSATTVFASENWETGESRFWLSPWSIVKGFAKSEPKLVKSAKLFGLEGLHSLNGKLLPPSTTAGSWKLNYSLQMAMPPAKGLAILSFKNGPKVEPPKLFDESMDHLAISYLDMKPWFKGVSHAVDQMIDEETPGNFADLVDSILTDPEGPQIDVRKELIYPSGPLMFNFGKTRREKKNTDRLQHSQVWACLLSDAKRATTLVDKLFADDSDIKAEQIGPYRIWNTVNDESLFIAVSNTENASISIAAIDEKYVYLSNDAAWFKGLLAGTREPESKAEQPALWTNHLHQSKASAISLQQGFYLGSWLERSWSRIPEPTHKELSSVDLPSYCLTKFVVPGVEVSDVPKWSQVQPTLGIVTHTAIQNEQGLEGQVELATK